MELSGDRLCSSDTVTEQQRRSEAPRNSTSPPPLARSESWTHNTCKHIWEPVIRITVCVMDREPLMFLIIQASEKTTEILYISGSKGVGRGQVTAFGRGASDAMSFVI